VAEGQLRIEYRDIVFFGENSRQSAQLAVVADKQGKYQEFHDVIFAKGSTVKDADFSAKAIATLAERIGVDARRLAADAAHADTEALVQKNHAEVGAMGVIGTPKFIINGRPVIGVQPMDVFIQAIGQELAR
jgi:protein-disulfide isomerase